jgi:hypothetical protein
MPTNTNLALRLPVLLLAFAGCTTSGTGPTNTAPRQDAEHAFSAASAALEAAAGSLDPHVARLTGQINVSSPCSQSGSIDLVGAFDSDAGTRFDLDATFDACAEIEGELDGTLHWRETGAGTTFTDEWTGTLTFIDSAGSWSCVFDYSATIDDAGEHYAGTICGYDVNADLNLDE